MTYYIYHILYLLYLPISHLNGIPNSKIFKQGLLDRCLLILDRYVMLKFTALSFTEHNLYDAATKLQFLVKHIADRTIGESSFIYFARNLFRDAT